MRSILALIPLLIAFLSVSSQAQTYTSKVIDAKSKKAIPYATVQYGQNQGVITNEEGLFNFTIDTRTQLLDSLYISSMGYEKKGFLFNQAMDSVIYISPKAIALSGVYLFDKELSVDDIIEKMIDRLPENTNNTPIKQRYFLRQSVFGNIQKVDFGFEKSSIEELDEALMDSIARAIPRYSSHYTETLGDFYKTKNAYKFDVLKAAELYDKNNIGSFEDLGERMEEMFKKNVKPDSYLKIKSGIFSQKVQVDSIMNDLEAEEAKELEKEIQKDTVSGLVDGQKHIFDELLSEVFYQEDTKLNVVNKKRKYNFSLGGYSEIEDQGVYVIDFVPKGSADFKGRIFINIEDFAVMRIDFENLKNLRNFRLLGIFYRETLYKGSMHFTKLNNGRYELKFADLNFGRWFRFDRPLDVIEKNKNVKGRRKQNELRLNIDFRMTNTNKWEFVAFENTLIDQAQFDTFKEDKSVEATYMPRYNPEFWKGYNIMEPNQAIRGFTVEEAE
ncbi:carboxypeptidase-like regulatory domain-containing protein [uncultured Croceitalea sp.]|uniref:carboxypeptidase-like regulatory domain-containing protein n=1 Tax=uncultured Croceitalea sp. TaxID=1798908 RepID=UPI0033056F8F